MSHPSLERWNLKKSFAASLMAFSGVTRVKFTAAPERKTNIHSQWHHSQISSLLTINLINVPLYMPKYPSDRMVLIRQSDLQSTVHASSTSESNDLNLLHESNRLFERSHVSIEARSILLVLKAGFGQIDGKHAGNTDQSRHTAVYELGRHTGAKHERRRHISWSIIEF